MLRFSRFFCSRGAITRPVSDLPFFRSPFLPLALSPLSHTHIGLKMYLEDKRHGEELDELLQEVEG